MKAKARHITELKETEIGTQGYEPREPKQRHKEIQRYWAKITYEDGHGHKDAEKKNRS
jgi:hypothetical protein